jgi:pantothenate kinase-related protein Tda10
LRRFADSWTITFTGGADFTWRLQAITEQQLDGALLAGYSEHEVVEYVEHRMRSAGYALRRQLSPQIPDDAAEWSLRFSGKG